MFSIFSESEQESSNKKQERSRILKNVTPLISALKSEVELQTSLHQSILFVGLFYIFWYETLCMCFLHLLC